MFLNQGIHPGFGLGVRLMRQSEEQRFKVKFIFAKFLVQFIQDTVQDHAIFVSDMPHSSISFNGVTPDCTANAFASVNTMSMGELNPSTATPVSVEGFQTITAFLCWQGM